MKMFLRTLALFAVSAPALIDTQAQQAPTTPQTTMGQWQNGAMLPFFPVHMHMLSTGKLMMWPGDGGVSGNDPRLFDPATGSVTTLAKPGYDVFCSGHSFLPDGRLFVAGGHISNNVGLAASSIYDPVSDTWTQQGRMNLGRWYPTDQVLPNGDVLVVSGDVDLSTGENALPQVWQASTGTWRSLTGAQMSMGLYPTLSLAPNGKVFNSGPPVTTRYLDTSGTGVWTTVGNHVNNIYRDYDSVVMYAPGKVLVAGGGDPATNTAEVIDLNAPVPAWRATGSMALARRQMNATMLPDGKVLVTGGTHGPGFNDQTPASADYAAEMWDPATEQWTMMASAALPRLYHSIAMLLPDGRVLTTGGNGFNQTELFSPPYLFAGPRPTITSAPTNVQNGQSFSIGTPDAANVSSVSWVRLASVTHTLSMSQAFFSSTAITRQAGSIQVSAPNDPTMPPGYYMLFVLNHGVPSVASIVHLGTPVAGSPQPVLSSLAPASIPAGDPPTTVTLSGSSFTTSSVVQMNGSSLPTTFVSATQLSAVVPAGALQKAGVLPLTVLTPAPGGGTSTPAPLTVTATAVPNLTQTGTIIARVMAPIGGGNKNLEVIRDGDMPPVGSKDSSRQYDSYSGGGAATEDWIGYQYATPQSFGTVVFQEGINFVDGGWFNNLNVQVRQNGAWVNVTNLVASPVYPANDGVSFETYKLSFTPVTGDAIRIDGQPGGSAAFISVGELQVYGPATLPPDLTHSGTPITSVPAPMGLGNKSLEVIRDADLPMPGTRDPSRQFDTYNGGGPSAEVWVGYQYSAPQTFTRLLFQEGQQFVDGGWFAQPPAVQVRQNGAWVNVPGATVTPVYGGQDWLGFVTYQFSFAPVTGDAIRIDGQPGGSASFISVGELQVFGSASPDLTRTGTPMISVPAPIGMGNRNLEVIRDGDMPMPGTKDPNRQFDTYNGGGATAEAWVGYQYSMVQTFGRVVLQEGQQFGDGGWFVKPVVQVRQNGVWTAVPGTTVAPVYGGADGLGFVTYVFSFPPVSGDAIRIDGQPGGSASFISVGELQVFGP